MSLQLRHQSHESVVYIDNDSAPRIVASGLDFLLEDLPVGTRVIYPNAPLKGLPNREAAIRHALNHPLDSDPLFAQLRPGMRVTIAVDDISLPLPPMKTPDIRQTMLEILLEMLTSFGIDDIHIVIAISVHRKMTEAEIRRMVGPRVFSDYYPDRLYNHDAEWEEGMVEVGRTRHGEVLRLNRRCVESDLVIYANINFVPMNGGHKSVAVGLCDYESLRAHHNPETIRDSNSYMDPNPAHSALSRNIGRLGRLADEHLNVFHIETAINNRMYRGEMDFLTKNEDTFSLLDRMKYEAMRASMSKMPRAVKRKMLHTIPSNYEMTSCYAGKTEPVHEKVLQRSFDQYTIPVKGQCDILICPVPDISPYNVNSVLNPLLVQVMALGYHFNMYRNQPLLRKGGVMILHHPCYDEFDHEFHPSYIEFFNRLLPETRDAVQLRERYEREFASNPSYVSMYRRGNAYHGSHPFFMWYWGENGRQHVGRVIAAGAENAHVPAMMGWERADNLTEAIAMARSYMGRSAEITMLHQPVIGICDVS
ncbi:MAG TPA: lactate racemase domain-containing protein [Pyrinomonadaceae bacterium]|nr:lactate racemase domain-containing protein [Pyrinomonadaceae bacterium]